MLMITGNKLYVFGTQQGPS